jgi:hypothetical protein
MKARDAASSGWPGERKTSWTMGGASVEDWWWDGARAFLRCSKPLRPDANEMAEAAGILIRLD